MELTYDSAHCQAHKQYNPAGMLHLTANRINTLRDSPASKAWWGGALGATPWRNSHGSDPAPKPQPSPHIKYNWVLTANVGVSLSCVYNALHMHAPACNANAMQELMQCMDARQLLAAMTTATPDHRVSRISTNGIHMLPTFIGQP